VSFEAKGRKLLAMRFNLDAFRPHQIERTPHNSHSLYDTYLKEEISKDVSVLKQLLTYSMEQSPS